MREDIAGPQGASSRPMWEALEGMVREKAQEFIQQIMEEEVTELSEGTRHRGAELGVRHGTSQGDDSTQGPQADDEPGVAQIPGEEARGGEDPAAHGVRDEHAGRGEGADRSERRLSRH